MTNPLNDPNFNYTEYGYGMGVIPPSLVDGSPAHTPTPEEELMAIRNTDPLDETTDRNYEGLRYNDGRGK